MASKLLGGVFDESGEPCASIVVADNALKTESDVRTERQVVALDKITRIRCFDVSPKFPLKFFLILLAIGLCTIWFVVGVIPLAWAGYIVYKHNKNKGTYELVIELTSGSNFFIKSQDRNFLDISMDALFDVVQHGTGNRIINIDASRRIVNSGVYNEGGIVNGNVGAGR